MNVRPAPGFTLIEVLVALVIVAAGMSALMSALGSSADSVSYLRDKTFAEWVALNQIATFRLKLTQGQIPAVASTNGDVDYAGRSWHWRQDIVATQIQGMMRIDVKVRPKELKAGDDDGWYVTVSGLTDDAIAAPGSARMVDWEGTSFAAGLGGANSGTQLNPNNATPTGTGANGQSTGTNTGSPQNGLQNGTSSSPTGSGNTQGGGGSTPPNLAPGTGQ